MMILRWHGHKLVSGTQLTSPALASRIMTLSLSYTHWSVLHFIGSTTCTVINRTLLQSFRFIPGYQLDKNWRTLLSSGSACRGWWLQSIVSFLYQSLLQTAEPSRKVRALIFTASRAAWAQKSDKTGFSYSRLIFQALQGCTLLL